jgi:RNA polymerase sigma factor (TIGR02999 family)
VATSSDESSNENGAEVTQLLHAARAGDRGATDALLEAVYSELRKLASARMAAEPQRGAGMTLQATSLVHEAYLRLITPPRDEPQRADQVWKDRGHFFGAAALAMRRILVERARHNKRIKHGGGQARLNIDDGPILSPEGEYDGTDLVALDEALKKLEAFDARKAAVVALRYFTGLSIEETAAAMDLSPATVKNEWAFARAWLHRELSGED